MPNIAYQGAITPKFLANGPVKSRRCTDVLCLVIFGLFWFGMFSIGQYAIREGHPQAYLAPYDQFGNPCGEGQTAKYPYLYFIENAQGFFLPNNTVCVAKCPQKDSSSLKCAPDYQGDNRYCEEIKVYATVPYFERFCLPQASKMFASLYKTNALNFSYLFEAMGDLKENYWLLFVVAGIALLIGFIYLILMKFFAGIVIWMILLSIFGSFVLVGLICLQKPLGIEKSLSKITPEPVELLEESVRRTLGLSAFGSAFVSLVVICYFKHRINLAIAVLKTAADFIGDEKGILIIPPVFFLKSVVFYIVWFLTAVYLVGTNKVRPSPTHLPIAEIEWTTGSKWLMGYFIFGLFWNNAFDIALSQFIISSTVCMWYFKITKSITGKFPLITSLFRCITHFGSIAYGSLLVGILDFWRLIITFLNSRFGRKDEQTGEDRRGYCLLCCDCVLGCFENALRFINRHAYTQIAMTGKGFCEATEDAYYLMIRNAWRFGTVHGLGGIYTFVGELAMTSLATLYGYILITQHPDIEAKIYSPPIMCVFFAITSFIIAHVFMGVYGVSADTIVHCFAMDEEMNNGSAVHAPERLQDFAEVHLGKKLIDHPDQ